MASRRPFYFEWIYQNYSQFLRVLFICYSTFACTQQSGCDKRVRVLLFRTMLMDKTRHCDAFPTNTFHEYRQRWNNSIQSNNNSFIREQRIWAAVTCRWRLSTWRRTWSIGVRFFFSIRLRRVRCSDSVCAFCLARRRINCYLPVLRAFRFVNVRVGGLFDCRSLFWGVSGLRTNRIPTAVFRQFRKTCQCVPGKCHRSAIYRANSRTIYEIIRRFRLSQQIISTFPEAFNRIANNLVIVDQISLFDIPLDSSLNALSKFLWD